MSTSAPTDQPRRRARRGGSPAGDRGMPAPPWGSAELVALVGGPRGRRWYFRPDAERLRSSLARIGRTLPYRPTEEYLPHPEYAAVGLVWRWTGQGEVPGEVVSATERVRLEAAARPPVEDDDADAG